MTYPIKMALLVRKDLKLTPGKVASQTAHVAVRCALKMAQARPKMLEQYLEAEAKYVLSCADLGEILRVASRASDLGCVVYVFVDGGTTTQGTAGEVTAVGVFDVAAKVDKACGRLELY